MLKRLFSSLMVISLFSGLLLGCWDRQEIEMRMAVTAMGIDLSKEGYKFTTAVPIPQLIVGGAGGGAGEGGNPVEFFSVKAKNLSEAGYKLETQASKVRFVGNMQVILFSEAVARQGIESFLDLFRRDPEIRRQLWPVVVKGTAENAITKTVTNMEQIPTNFIRDMLDKGKRVETVPDFDLGRLFVELSSKSRQAPLLNYIIAEKDKYHWEGIAVFKRGKMIGLLKDLEEINVLLQTRFGYKGRLVMAQCGEDHTNNISFLPSSFSREIKVTERPEIQVNVHVKGKIYEKNCSLNLRDEKNLSLIEKKIAATYKEAAERLVRRAQQEWKWDIFHFGDHVRAYHPTIWNRDNWWQSFPNIPIKIDYQVKINRIGMQSY